jgi:integral membrane protein (TIGR01906 family)
VILLYNYTDFSPHSIWQRETVDYLLDQQYYGLFNANYLSVYEKRHLLDVKILFSFSDKMLIFSCIGNICILLIAIFYLNINNLFTKIVYLGFASILLLLCLVLWGDFIYLFHSLHKIFFTNNTWIFYPESRLTQIFPLAYFYKFSIIYIAILSLLLILIYIFTKLRWNKTLTWVEKW